MVGLSRRRSSPSRPNQVDREPSVRRSLVQLENPFRFLIFLAFLILTTSPAQSRVSPSTTPAKADARCTALATSDFSSIQDAPTQVTKSESAKGADGAGYDCRVLGYVAPQIG